MAILTAACRLPWRRLVIATLRTAIWTGNNSGTSFSVKTVSLMLCLLAVAVGVYCIRAYNDLPPVAERVLVGGVLSYCAGLGYAAVVTFWSTRGAAVSLAPWYCQVLLGPGLCLLLVGLYRGGRIGQGVRIAMIWMWAYVICATYIVKLIPLYSGFSGGRTDLAELWRWYTGPLERLSGALGMVALVPAAVVLWLTTGVVTMALGLAVRLSGLDPLSKKAQAHTSPV